MRNRGAIQTDKFAPHRAPQQDYWTAPDWTPSLGQRASPQSPANERKFAANHSKRSTEVCRRKQHDSVQWVPQTMIHWDMFSSNEILWRETPRETKSMSAQQANELPSGLEINDPFYHIHRTVLWVMIQIRLYTPSCSQICWRRPWLNSWPQGQRYLGGWTGRTLDWRPQKQPDKPTCVHETQFSHMCSRDLT